MITLAAMTLLALAHAAAAPAGDVAARKARAIEFQEQADAAFRAGDYRTALAAAQRSFEVYPAARTAYNVAVIQIELGQRQAAFAQLLQGLGLEPSLEEARLIETSLADLGPSLQPPQGWIKIVSEPTGAQIAAASAQPLGVTPAVLGLEAGAHQLTLSRDGFHSARAPVHITPGRGTELAASLAPLAGAQNTSDTASAPTGDAGAAARAAACPPCSSGEDQTVLLGTGVALAAGGALSAAGLGFGVYTANAQVADASSPWETRSQAALYGLLMGVGAVVATGVLVGGGALTATALLADGEAP